MQLHLPRWNKDSVITHSDLNKLAEAIEIAANLEVDTSSGLQITYSKTGKTICAVTPRVAVYGIISTAVTALSGTTLGKGQFNRYYKDDNNVLQPYNGPPEDCYNTCTSTIAVGAKVQLKWVDNIEYVVDVVDCSGS